MKAEIIPRTTGIRRVRAVMIATMETQLAAIVKIQGSRTTPMAMIAMIVIAMLERHSPTAQMGIAGTRVTRRPMDDSRIHNGTAMMIVVSKDPLEAINQIRSSRSRIPTATMGTIATTAMAEFRSQIAPILD
jgi:hypothetical protein